MGGMEALRLPPTSPTRALPVQARATVSSQRQGSADTQRPMRPVMGDSGAAAQAGGGDKVMTGDIPTHAGRRKRAASQRRANQVASHQARKDRRKQSIGAVLAGAPVKLARFGKAEIARRKVVR